MSIEEQTTSSEHYWCDKDTFCYWLHEYKDAEGDDYDILIEYHSDEDSYFFVKVYEFDQMDLQDNEVSKDEKEYIINHMKAWMTI